MKIIFATYSNKKNNHLNRYQSSCFHNDIQPIILGKDDKFFSFKNKIITMENFLNTLDRNDLSKLEWINHAQEELMDGILYLEKLKKEIEHGKEDPGNSKADSEA